MAMIHQISSRVVMKIFHNGRDDDVVGITEVAPKSGDETTYVSHECSCLTKSFSFDLPPLLCRSTTASLHHEATVFASARTCTPDGRLCSKGVQWRHNHKPLVPPGLARVTARPVGLHDGPFH